MRHMTHKSWLKLIGTALVSVSVVVAFSFSSASSAKPLDMEVTQVVRKEVACFVYARYLGLGREAVGNHLRRIGEATKSAGAVYRLGYVEGMIEGLGSANAEKLGGFKAAKLHAAKHMYKIIGCDSNESI